MYYFALLLWQTKAVIWGNTPYAANWCKDQLYLEHSVSECSLTIASFLKKTCQFQWTDVMVYYQWKQVVENQLTQTVVSVHTWTYPLSLVMHLYLFGCLRASAYQCSVRPGLVHGKFKNQTYSRYQLPSMHSQTCFSALCEPNTQTPTLLKKKNLSLSTIFSRQMWESSVWNLLTNTSTWRAAITRRALPQEMLCTLSHAMVGLQMHLHRWDTRQE